MTASRRLNFIFNTVGPFLILLFVTALFGALLAWRDLTTMFTVQELKQFLNGGLFHRLLFEPETIGSWSGIQAALDLIDYADFFGFGAFFSFENLKIVLTQTVIVAIAALGMTMIIVSGGIDLSAGSAIALTSVVGAALIQKETGLPGVIALTILAGGAVGLVNGSLIAGFRMTPFIVTLGMLGVARGVAKWLAGNQTVNFPESAIGLLMKDPDPLGKMPPPGVWIALVLALCMIVVMRKTTFGRYIFAVGSNEATARLCGIRTRRIKLSVYMLGGLFAGLAGLMQLARLRQGDPTASIGLELDIIAAVVIGGASLSGGTGSILGSMIGALTMAVLRAGSQYMDWPNYMQEIIIGVLIVLAVGLDRIRQSKTSGAS